MMKEKVYLIKLFLNQNIPSLPISVKKSTRLDIDYSRPLYQRLIYKNIIKNFKTIKLHLTINGEKYTELVVRLQSSPGRDWVTKRPVPPL